MKATDKILSERQVNFADCVGKTVQVISDECGADSLLIMFTDRTFCYMESVRNYGVDNIKNRPFPLKNQLSYAWKIGLVNAEEYNEVTNEIKEDEKDQVEQNAKAALAEYERLKRLYEKEWTKQNREAALAEYERLKKLLGK